MASRSQAVKEVIAPALSAGKIVICDRFLDSTVAYQGYGLGLSLDFIRRLGKIATGNLKPHLTILLDLPVQSGLARCGKTKDRIEKRPLRYHLRVRQGYLRLARQEPRRIRIIRVEKNKNQTQKKIRDLISDVL
jgi:dTMP kinase